MQVSILYLYEPACFTEKFSRTSTIHSGIPLGQELWAESVSPQMNTIASRDQFNQ